MNAPHRPGPFRRPDEDEGAVARRNVLRVWQVFLRRWHIPTGMALYAIVTLVVYMGLKPPTYRADGTVQLGLYATATGDPREALRWSAEVTETHRNLLTSHSVVETALQSLGRELKEGLGRREQRDEFLFGMRLRPIPRTYLVEVSAIGKDPKDVVDRVNALMDAFIPFTEEFLGSRDSLVLKNLQQKEAGIQTKLTKAEGLVADFLREVGTSQFAELRASELHAMSGVRRRAAELELQRASLVAGVERLEQRLLETKDLEDLEELTGRLGGQGLLERRQVLKQIKTQLVLLGSTVTEDHPDYLELRQKLDSERAAFVRDLRDTATIELESRREQLASLKVELRQLERERQRLEQALADLDRKEDRFVRLRREVDWYDRELEQTRARLRLVRSQEQGDIGARIVNRAEVPMLPEARFRVADFFFSSLLAFGLGVFGLVVWDHLKDQITQERQILPLGVPLLARVPSFPPQDLPEPGTAEAFDFLGTNLLALDPPPRVVMCSSPQAGDGKSFVAHRLSAYFAALGRDTLLVCSSAQGSPVVGSADAPGLTNVLAGETTLEDAVQGTSVANLSVLTRGTHAGGADLFLSGGCRPFFESLLEGYESVVIDAASVSEDVETSLVAPFVDALVLVARLEHTGFAKLVDAIHQLESAGAALRGIVLNGVAPSGSRERASAGNKVLLVTLVVLALLLSLALVAGLALTRR